MRTLPLDILDSNLMRPYLTDRDVIALLLTDRTLKGKIERTRLYHETLARKKRLVQQPRLNQYFGPNARPLSDSEDLDCFSFVNHQTRNLERYIDHSREFIVFFKTLLNALIHNRRAPFHPLISESDLLAINNTLDKIDAINLVPIADNKKLKLLSFCSLFIHYFAQIHQLPEAESLHKQHSIISETLDNSQQLVDLNDITQDSCSALKLLCCLYCRPSYEGTNRTQKVLRGLVAGAGALMSLFGGITSLVIVIDPSTNIIPEPLAYSLIPAGVLLLIASVVVPIIKEKCYRKQQTVLLEQIVIENPDDEQEHIDQNPSGPTP